MKIFYYVTLGILLAGASAEAAAVVASLPKRVCTCGVSQAMMHVLCNGNKFPAEEIFYNVNGVVGRVGSDQLHCFLRDPSVIKSVPYQGSTLNQINPQCPSSVPELNTAVEARLGPCLAAATKYCSSAGLSPRAPMGALSNDRGWVSNLTKTKCQ